ncbi:homoprotocatechuate degradation operon regulator HpaR [Paraburkholderia sp. BL27I4N3]|uniref:homoprotocatechuate degradation operon regulator HpaR n=1 Tax=Paraburkholderia sp. BL27I4N3 TaxID=1938805 RepID=UPI0015F27C44|nr:homoprotocatechuate degradation operon regulator HpaR [Paraburkholderia sp. BL27I4N3]
MAFLLLTVREQVRSHFQPTFRQFGITEQQWRILRLLDEQNELGMSQIADACLVMRPSILGIVARMEESDLVTRREMTKDEFRRRVAVSLTPRGRALVNEIQPIFESIYRKLDAVLGPERLDELYRVLEYTSAHLASVSENELSDQ